MTLAEMGRREREAKAYAAERGIKYLPCFYREERLPGWRSIKRLEATKGVAEGTFDRWVSGRAMPPEIASASWCELCRDNPVASHAGLCIWCEMSPIGQGIHVFHTPRAA